MKRSDLKTRNEYSEVRMALHERDAEHEARYGDTARLAEAYYANGVRMRILSQRELDPFKAERYRRQARKEFAEATRLFDSIGKKPN